MISVFSLPLTAGYLAAAFFLFRVFDILKPAPIRHIERSVKGGLGVMLDDAVAGLMTNLLLHIWRICCVRCFIAIDVSKEVRHSIGSVTDKIKGMIKGSETGPCWIMSI